jgi:hypothetical protein
MMVVIAMFLALLGGPNVSSYDRVIGVPAYDGSSGGAPVSRVGTPAPPPPTGVLDDGGSSGPSIIPPVAPPLADGGSSGPSSHP